jgi:glucan phosphoethanolaminetransferase (alkaline phosphatase superfamily)
VAALGLVALVGIWLMLPNFVLLGYTHESEDLLVLLFLPTSLFLLLFALLGSRLWIAFLLLTPFAALAPLETFFAYTYRHPTSSEVLATLAASNPREIREYLGGNIWLLGLCMVAGLLLPLMAAWWSWRMRLQWRHSSRAWVITAGIAIPLAVGIVPAIRAKGSMDDRLQAGERMLDIVGFEVRSCYPFGLPARIADYHSEWVQMKQAVAQLRAFRFHAYRTVSVNQRQTYVLVIGEASRRDHWQLFGYDRATNPEMSRIGNLVLMPDFDSSWPESMTAIPMVVTRKPPTDLSLSWNEPSIIRAMQEAGFETWWISNQLPIGQYDSPVSIYAYEAEHVVFLNHASWTAPGSYDEDLLPSLLRALHDSKRDQFIVLHMMGSHNDYDFRYPDSYKHFRPTLSDSFGNLEHAGRARNSYDNTILYTDHVLASILGILANSNTVSALWFESDHGEALPTQACTLMGHGSGTRFEFQIPALFWYSDSYLKMFPSRVQGLRANAGSRAMSANTFESLIDMTGVNYPGHDATLSLFSPQWQYRPRIVNGYFHANIDNAQFGSGCEHVLPPHG